MTKLLLRGIAVAAMTGFVLAARAQDANQYPIILQQPADQCLPLDASVSFSVVATNVDYYQWYKNNVAIDGETNSSITILNLGTDDAAYYGAAAIKGGESVPSRLALLNVYTISGTTSTVTTTTKKLSRFASSSLMTTMSLLDGGGSSIVVFSPPVMINGSNACAGSYSGFANYLKPVSQGWGFYTDTNTAFHAATDYNRSDTKVSYVGYSGDANCGLTNVIVPDPTFSPKYRFTIYFPRGSQVPTNSYPITLDGFNP